MGTLDFQGKAPYAIPVVQGVAVQSVGTSVEIGRTTVESTFRIDIDSLRRHRLIGLGRGGFVIRGGCVIRFSGPYHDLDVECETHIDDPWNGCVRLKYESPGYWRAEPLVIDDKIFLATSRPPFGGLRWCFVCPRSNRRVRKLSLPLGGRHFWSRRAYELAYASQRETRTYLKIA